MSLSCATPMLLSLHSGIDVDTRHAAIDGLGNFFKACTVNIVEAAVCATPDDVVDTTIIAAERSLLGAQLRNVLDMLVDNLQDCVDITFGESLNRGEFRTTMKLWVSTVLMW